VKVWRRQTGQCIASFADHKGGITGVATCGPTNAFFTCSTDGTCRGFDLVRYRNFRVFEPAEATQFGSIAVDPAGELLVAGSTRSGTATMWAVQTGKVVDELIGHEAPITSLAFHPSGAVLVTAAADKTMAIWDLFSNNGDQGEALRHRAETVQLSSEPLAVTFSLNGSRMAVLMMSGEVQVFDTLMPTEPVLVRAFSTKLEATGGWNGNVGPQSANAHAHFTTVALSPEGDKLVCGGESKHIAMFHADQGFLLQRYPVTTNTDVLGMSEQINYAQRTDGGDFANDIDVSEEDPHLRARKLIELPGAKHAHFATGKRKTELVARTMHATFASHGREFLCATTDGVRVFSTDVRRETFAPLELREGLTSSAVEALLRRPDGSGIVEGLVGALLLQDALLIAEALRRTPPAAMALAATAIPTAAFPSLLTAVAAEVQQGSALEHSLRWARCLLLRSNEPLFGAMRTDAVASSLRLLHRAVSGHDQLRQQAADNSSLLSYLTKQARLVGHTRPSEAAGPIQ
jgi:periodic tryptophan protein 2